MTSDARRSADHRRAKAKPWRRWYSRKAWRIKRKAQLARIPWCEPCASRGKTTPATIANHKIPHRGDPLIFWHGPLESTCKDCHDAIIQRAEIRGFRDDIDDDGWPTDPDHPFNRPRKAHR